jgi:hypothetical protein
MYLLQVFIFGEHMNIVMKSVLAMASLALSVTASAQNFGGKVDHAVLTPISSIVAAPDKYLAKPVTVQGEIISVCSNKGCWMQLASDAAEQQFKIKVRDGDMVFPVSAKGKKALATGQLVKTELDLESSREHLAELAERNKQAFDASSVTKPIVLLQLVPTAVEISE